MPIPFLDLAAQHTPIRAEIDAAIARVLDSNHYILGPEVTAFESEIADYLGVKHAIGVSSGTDALLASLMALDIGPGDEVITTPFTFFATAGSVARLGATVVFADIDPLSFNVDPSAVAAKVTDKTKAIIAVDLFGRVADIPSIKENVGPKIPIIEDAAQSLGSGSKDVMGGTLGMLGCYSFFPAKNLGCLGDGGLIVTDDAALDDRLRRLRVHGSKPKYFHAMVGGSFRLDALQAAVLRVKLPHLDRWVQARVANAAKYNACFESAGIDPGLLKFPELVEGHSFNQYVIRTSKRDALRAHLQAQCIPTQIYYPLPLHLQECFADMELPKGSFAESERAAEEVLALPIFAELGHDNVEHIANAVVDFLSA